MTSKKLSDGTDNVLIDLGFNDAPELSAKAELAVMLALVSLDQRVKIVVQPARRTHEADITVAA